MRLIVKQMLFNAKEYCIKIVGQRDIADIGSYVENHFALSFTTFPTSFAIEKVRG